MKTIQDMNKTLLLIKKLSVLRADSIKPSEDSDRRATIDVIKYLKKTNKHGILAYIHFEKSFHTGN